MRLLSASLALLGTEAAMAGTFDTPRGIYKTAAKYLIADFEDLTSTTAITAFDDASPTRPRAPGQLQETRRIPPAPTAAIDLQLQHFKQEEGQSSHHQHQQADEDAVLWYHQEAKRQQMSSSSSSASASASNSGGGVPSVLSESGAIYETSTIPTGPVTTSLAFFTAGGGVYSVSALSNDINVVAGKTLSEGGPDALVGGEVVTLASSGLVVNGVEAGFETVTFSASASTSESMSLSMSGSGSSVGPEASASGVASAGSNGASQSSSPGAAVPRATAGAGVVAAVGAVVGVLML